MQVGNLERLFMVKLEEEILGVNRWRESRKENKVEEYLDSYYKTKKTNPFVSRKIINYRSCENVNVPFACYFFAVKVPLYDLRSPSYVIFCFEG